MEIELIKEQDRLQDQQVHVLLQHVRQVHVQQLQDQHKVQQADRLELFLLTKLVQLNQIW
jgi:hypothetical protein